MEQEERLEYLIDYLLNENPNAKHQIMSLKRNTLKEKITLFRGLCNIRPPEPVTEQFIRVQDAFLTRSEERRVGKECRSRWVSEYLDEKRRHKKQIKV